MKTPMPVSMDGVTKSYGTLTVLDGIDLSVRGGELVCLLGPSGCGKTTALRLIAGFDRPDAGMIRFGPRDVTGVSARRRGVGIVFQSYSLFPHLSARDNIAYGLAVRRRPRSERAARADELLELVGLASHGDHYPHQLSGGQQQRVALARALAVEPDVLLLDEPLSALDAQVRQQLRDEIRRLQREMGTTTVLVTHDQEEALTLADRVAVMDGGRIVQLADPETVYRRPSTPFVASFVGVVNRIPATVARSGRVCVLGAELVAREPVATTTDSTPGRGPMALVRPEDLVVRPSAAGAGTVTTTALRGAIVSTYVDWPGVEIPLRIDTPAHEHPPVAAGQRVCLQPRTHDVLLDIPLPTTSDLVTA